MERSLRVGRISFFLDFLMLAAGAVLGATYLLKYVALGRGYGDIVFVSFLLVATAILLFGLFSLRRYVIDEGFNYWNYILKDGEHIENALFGLMQRVFQSFGRIISGVLYGLLICVVVDRFPFIGRMGPEKIEYLAFLFSINYLTGGALFSLTTFLTAVPGLTRNIHVQLWETKNPASAFLINSTLRLGLFASLYVSLCMTSIIFSEIPIQSLVVLYVAFSASMAGLSIVLPFYFYARRIQFLKDRMTFRIGAELNKLSDELMGADGGESDPKRFDRMKELVQLREWVQKIELLPFRLRSISAAIAIVFFTVQPFIADLIRDMLTK